MKNLENYGVQELNAKEILIIGGGQTTPPPGWDPSQEAVDLGTVTNSHIGRVNEALRAFGSLVNEVITTFFF